MNHFSTSTIKGKWQRDVYEGIFDGIPASAQQQWQQSDIDMREGENDARKSTGQDQWTGADGEQTKDRECSEGGWVTANLKVDEEFAAYVFVSEGIWWD